MNNFAAWLKHELDKRDMSPADLARRGTISEQSISKILHGKRQPGLESLIGVADGFHIPRAEVFRAAGIIEKEPESRIEELATRIESLRLDQQKFIDTIIDTFHQQNERGNVAEKETGKT